MRLRWSNLVSACFRVTKLVWWESIASATIEAIYEPSQQAARQRYLLDDERIRWMGHPNPRHLFESNDLFLIPFSLLWGRPSAFLGGGRSPVTWCI